MPSAGPSAEAARTAFREAITGPGHAVDQARSAVAGLEAAFAAGSLARTPALDRMIADLALATAEPDQVADPGRRLGGKSAEAARFILRAIDRELAEA